MRKLYYIILMAIALISQSAHAIELSPKHKTDIQQAQLYLNSIGTLTANFTQTTQIANDVSSGTLWLKRPGKIRWHYDDPIPIDIAIRGDNVTYLDRELNQISYTSLEDTLAAFLTREHIDFFSQDLDIINFVSEDNIIHVTVTQKSNPDQGHLTLIFQIMPKVVLQGLHVRDAIGQTTFITFHDQQINKPINDKQFILVKPVA